VTATDPGQSAFRHWAGRKWGLITIIVLLISAVAWGERWSYYRSSKSAAQAQQFQKLETDLNQPAFSGISTDVHGYKYSNGEKQDVVATLDAVKLNETIAFSLTPAGTIGDCSASNTETIIVTLIAPAFTITPIGSGSRSRKELIAKSCDLSAKEPPAPPPWRWNIVPIQAGHHLITLSLQALDKDGQEVAFKPFDIPVTVVAPETSLATYVGTVGTIIGVITGLFSLWGQFGKRAIGIRHASGSTHDVQDA
jgi:hypothetical protein